MPNAREQIVEVLGLDVDYLDADEYPFERITEHVKAGHDALCRIADALGFANDPELTPEDLADEVEKITADDPREQAFIWRIADEIGVPREQATGSHLVRLIRQAIAERDTFRAQLDEALVPLVKRARKLRVEDVLYDVESGRSWTIKRVEPDAFGVTLDVLAHHTGRLIEGKRIDHPDKPMTVLMALIERDGLLLLRKSLGVQLVDYDPNADEPTGEAS